jgi:hypothetical protein
MNNERVDYISLLQKKMQGIYDTYTVHFGKITNGFYHVPAP